MTTSANLWRYATYSIASRISIVVEHFTVNQTNKKVVIGGVRTLRDFSPEMVVVSVPGATLEIHGNALKIARFNENEIEIVGEIENVATIHSRKRSV